MEKKIITGICKRFINGELSQSVQDLPFEIQYQLNCSWGEALNIANAIRLFSAEEYDNEMGMCPTFWKRI